MDYKININKNIYVIKKLSDLSMDDYNKIFEIIEENDFRSLLYMLTDIPVKFMKHIPQEEIKKIDWNRILNEPLNIKPIQKQYLGKKLLNLERITNAKYFDLDYYLTTVKKQKMEYILALMLIGDDFHMEDIQILVEQIRKELKVSDIITPINMFINWRKQKLKKYESLFKFQNDDDEYNEDEDTEYEEEEEEEEEVVNDDYGWLGVAYDNAKEFSYISKVNIFDAQFTSFLNFLTWKQQKIQREIDQQQKNTNQLH